MQVSHETIYRALYVQARGTLKRELTRHLRRGRSRRYARSQSSKGQRQGKLTGMVMISERPPEVEDRAVPGHWEGDILMGGRTSAIATLVERQTRYCQLVALPDGNEPRRDRPGAPRRRRSEAQRPPARDTRLRNSCRQARRADRRPRAGRRRALISLRPTAFARQRSNQMGTSKTSGVVHRPVEVAHEYDTLAIRASADARGRNH